MGRIELKEGGENSEGEREEEKNTRHKKQNQNK